jgi:hypothetical protein
MTMKTDNRYQKLMISATLALIISGFLGCKPESSGELGEPFDKVKGITGTWELSAFTQQDLNSPVKETRDLSAFYIDGIATPLQLSFNADRTYTVTIEMGKNYFGNGGTWGFDDDLYPTYLELYTVEDTLQYNLGGMVREFDQNLDIEYRRDCGGTATNIYTFEFNRMN